MPPYRIHKGPLSADPSHQRYRSLTQSLSRFPLAMLVVFAPSAARAADPQPYKVSIQGSGVGEIDTVLRSSSQLVSLQDKVAVPPFALVQRARADIPRFQTALDSFGYYLNSVSI